MFVSGRDNFDFVVWWSNGKHVERIVKDDKFFNCNIEKALYFNKKVVMSEIVCKHFSRQAVLDSRNENRLPTSTSVSVVKYCICNSEDDGRRMIMCKNKNCPKM